MKRFVSLVALVIGMAACGGGGDSSPGTVGDRSGGQQLNATGLEATDRYIFDAEVAPGSVVEQAPLVVPVPGAEAPRETYLISKLDHANSFRRELGNGAAIAFDDLATHMYFLVPASDCPAYSEPAGIDHRPARITISINRFEPEAGAACPSSAATGFHVFKGKKSRAPEILFESLALPAQSHIGNERLEVIRDAGAWTALWAGHHRGAGTPPALPAIDFSEKMIVAVYIGMRPNGCYDVGIDRIYEDGETIIVEYTEHIPSSQDICTQALVSPSHVVVMPTTPYPFAFKKNVRSR
jgi:hypothetical protein